MDHNIPPVYDQNSTILILGSFPSVVSRSAGFYYHHPQNRFWRLISSIVKAEVPPTIQLKRVLLLKHHIALWDVIQSCDIKGSSDSSIQNVVPNDIANLLELSSIQRIYANGNKAAQLYQKYCLESTGIPIIVLPSTSPANAKSHLKQLKIAWEVIISIKE